MTTQTEKTTTYNKAYEIAEMWLEENGIEDGDASDVVSQWAADGVVIIEGPCELTFEDEAV